MSPKHQKEFQKDYYKNLSFKSKKVERVRTVGGPATEVFGYVPPNLDGGEVETSLKGFQSKWAEQEKLGGSACKASSDYYFKSYANFSIHEEMLKDTIRTSSYQRAIEENGHLFKDKIVLDVGSGTGILSMFAVKAGAKHVYAIECSEIVHLGRNLCQDNGYGDRITMIQNKAEDIQALPDNVMSVDIIVSEWMGYFLLYESMLDTVIYCRDKWLVKNGLIFPDVATLHIAGLEDAEYRRERFEFWNNCYGLSFSRAKKLLLEEPVVDSVLSDAVVTDPCCVLQLDLNTCRVSDLNFASHFKLKCLRREYVHALVAWFDCTFSKCHVPILFSTSPFSHYTHWKQTVFYLTMPITAERGEELTGIMAVRKNADNHRELDIKLQVEFHGRHSEIITEQYHRLK